MRNSMLILTAPRRRAAEGLPGNPLPTRGVCPNIPGSSPGAQPHVSEPGGGNNTFVLTRRHFSKR